jgi:hypothetical protein
MKILLGDLCVWLHREGIGNESLHETDDNVVWEVNFSPNPKPS